MGSGAEQSLAPTSPSVGGAETVRYRTDVGNPDAPALTIALLVPKSRS